MSDKILYSIDGPMLLRLAPWGPDATSAISDLDPDAGMAQMSVFIENALEIRVLMESLHISSPATAHAVEEFRRGELSASQVTRLAMTLSRYIARMSSRATPFGLLAGVGIAERGESLQLRLGNKHQKWSRPDSGWLASSARALEREPGRIPHLRVGINPHCRRRGSRLVLPAPAAEDAGQPAEGARPASVRLTPAVEELLRLCVEPTPVAEVTARMIEVFPQLSAQAVHQLVGQLIARGFLVSDLRPPMYGDSAAQWLNDNAVGDVADRLEKVEAALADYAACPVGEGTEKLRRVRQTMRDDSEAEHAEPHVDLVTDASASIPDAILEEMEHAASVMWRVSPQRELFHDLRAYYADFVAQYGFGNPVPVLDVLDPQVGPGAPPGYRNPPSTRAAESPSSSPDFCAALAPTVQQALLRGDSEIELTPQLVDALDEDVDSPVWRSFDFTVQVFAEDAEAVDSGDFLLACSPTWPTRRAGQVFGRFARALDMTSALREVFTRQAAVDQPRQTQIEYRPLGDRMANVAQVPRLTSQVLSLDAAHRGEGTTELRLADVGVCADEEGLYPVSLRDGAELDLSALHMLNPALYAPNAVRFLSEMEMLSTRNAAPWQWRELAVLPYLPRVRSGRTILHPARWKADELIEALDDGGDWAAAVARWRRRWHVPDHVVVSSQTQQLPLRLDRAWDVRLLYHELRRRRDSVVLEDLATSQRRGWTGGRACEITAMLFAAPDRARKARSPVSLQPSAAARPVGGEWMYLKIYSDRHSWDTLATEGLAQLVDSLPESVDRWFWLRYLDPRPHLRLRLHGKPEQLHTEVLPLVHDWVERVREAGLLREAELAEYEPETRRYGADAALSAAENAFCADSAAALAQLSERTAATLSTSPEVLAALNFLQLAHDFDWDVGAQWVSRSVDPAARNDLDRSDRRRMSELVDFDAARPAPRVELLSQPVRQAWDARSNAVAAYARTLQRDAVGPRRSEVLASLLHMHFNRLVGPDRPAEWRALSLLRETLHSHQARGARR